MVRSKAHPGCSLTSRCRVWLELEDPKVPARAGGSLTSILKRAVDAGPLRSLTWQEDGSFGVQNPHIYILSAASNVRMISHG